MVAAAIGLALALAFAPLDAAPAAQGDRPDLLVFAAASLQTALDELTPQVEAATGVQLRASYAASSTLARQIENGAPADLFISADLDWMDYLAARSLIQPGTRVDLLGNHLVLIAPAGEPSTLRIAPGFPLAAALGVNGRLAIADPDAVPAGKYARAALTALGVWDSVAGRLARAENVRAALLLVERGEVPLGIVYRTDAAVDPGVTVVSRFPDATHPPIVYPAALTRSARAGAARVLAFLQGPEASAVFDRWGFETKKQGPGPASPNPGPTSAVWRRTSALPLFLRNRQ
jgi:molybdate transport system substrate-binding protein